MNMKNSTIRIKKTKNRQTKELERTKQFFQSFRSLKRRNIKYTLIKKQLINKKLFQ